MWVWCGRVGGAPRTWPKARQHFLRFPKAKTQVEKIAINCMQLKKKEKKKEKVKSSQVNILIFDSYLLELCK